MEVQIFLRCLIRGFSMYYKMEVLEKIFLLLFNSINSFLSADTLFLLLAEMFNLDDIRNKNNKDHNKK